MTGAIPIYFLPSRNVYGIIGGISLNQFDEKEIRQKVKDNPLIKNKNVKIKLAVITNSTYDGLIYDTVKIKDKLGKVVDNLHFDEAWYSYARFHKIYDNRYAMTDNHDEKKHPTLYSTQSTHKLLAALSQSSMLHVKSGKNKINFDTFNEAFMMHTSTSPQYLIIASLDVAAKMMEGSKGKELMDDLIEEAITFRKKMVQMRNEILQEANDAERLWWFDIWQPSTVEVRLKKIVYMNFLNIEQKKLTNYSNYWTLKKDDKWHCFKNIDDEFMMLDPIKVTFITPGISRDGNMANWGIPAFIVSKYLITRGIVDEKTGFYTFLALFSLGVTKGKSSILISALIDFKKLYDENVLIEEYVPKFIDKYPIYKDIRLKELCNKMHLFLKKNDISKLTTKVFEIMPKPIMTPCEAYEKLIEKEIEEVPLDKLINRTPAVMLVPYPPGIPIIMPGEKITTKEKCLIDYLKFLENFDNKFPGFETETHGLIIKKEKGRIKYYVNCLK